MLTRRGQILPLELVQLVEWTVPSFGAYHSEKLNTCSLNLLTRTENGKKHDLISLNRRYQ